MICDATSRTCPTEPGAPVSSGACSVWTESITQTSGRSTAIVASTVSRSVSARTGTSSAPAPRRAARSRIWAADSSPDTYSVRRPAACRLPERHVRQRRLADPRRAAEQHERARHQAAAQDPVELADPGEQALDLRRPRRRAARRHAPPRLATRAARGRRRPRAWPGAASSASVFHSQQPGHCPCHLASRGHRPRTPRSTSPLPLDTRRGRRTSSPRATSASRSAVSSIPHEKRMKPSGDVVGAPAQRGARPTCAGRRSSSPRSRARRPPRKAAPRRRPLERERRRPRPGPGSGRRLTSDRSREHRRQRARVGHLALEAQRPVASERCASQVSNGPGQRARQLAPVRAAGRRRAWRRSPC